MERRLGSDHADLTGPLQAHLLPCLTGQAILALRKTCRALQNLVDSGPLSAVQQQWEGLLPSELHGTAADSQHLCSMVLVQAAAIAAVSDGSRATLHQIPTQPNQSIQDIQWQPCWPVRCTAIVMSSRQGSPSAPYRDSQPSHKQRGTQLLLVGLHSPIQQPSFLCPTDPVPPCLDSWAGWCKDSTHIVFEDARGFDGHVSIAVLNIHGGSLERVGCHPADATFSGTYHWLSPSKDALLLPQPEQYAAVCVYSLPSLQPIRKGREGALTAHWIVTMSLIQEPGLQ